MCILSLLKWKTLILWYTEIFSYSWETLSASLATVVRAWHSRSGRNVMLTVATLVCRSWVKFDSEKKSLSLNLRNRTHQAIVFNSIETLFGCSRRHIHTLKVQLGYLQLWWCCCYTCDQRHSMLDVANESKAKFSINHFKLKKGTPLYQRNTTGEESDPTSEWFIYHTRLHSPEQSSFMFLCPPCLPDR